MIIEISNQTNSKNYPQSGNNEFCQTLKKDIISFPDLDRKFEELFEMVEELYSEEKAPIEKEVLETRIAKLELEYKKEVSTAEFRNYNYFKNSFLLEKDFKNEEEEWIWNHLPLIDGKELNEKDIEEFAEKFPNSKYVLEFDNLQFPQMVFQTTRSIKITRNSEETRLTNKHQNYQKITDQIDDQAYSFLEPSKYEEDEEKFEKANEDKRAKLEKEFKEKNVLEDRKFQLAREEAVSKIEEMVLDMSVKNVLTTNEAELLEIFKKQNKNAVHYHANLFRNLKPKHIGKLLNTAEIRDFTTRSKKATKADVDNFLNRKGANYLEKKFKNDVIETKYSVLRPLKTGRAVEVDRKHERKMLLNEAYRNEFNETQKEKDALVKELSDTIISVEDDIKKRAKERSKKRSQITKRENQINKAKNNITKQKDSFKNEIVKLNKEKQNKIYQTFGNIIQDIKDFANISTEKKISIYSKIPFIGDFLIEKLEKEDADIQKQKQEEAEVKRKAELHFRQTQLNKINIGKILFSKDFQRFNDGADLKYLSNHFNKMSSGFTDEEIYDLVSKWETEFNSGKTLNPYDAVFDEWNVKILFNKEQIDAYHKTRVEAKKQEAIQDAARKEQIKQVEEDRKKELKRVQKLNKNKGQSQTSTTKPDIK